MYLELVNVENSPARLKAIAKNMQYAHFKYMQNLQFLINLNSHAISPTITPMVNPTTFSTKSIPIAYAVFEGLPPIVYAAFSNIIALAIPKQIISIIVSKVHPGINRLPIPFFFA
jgi:hypothetical protein